MHRPGMAVQTPGGWPKGAVEVAASQGASTAVLTTAPSAGRPSAPPPGAGHTAGAASADGVASCQPSGLSWLWTLYKIPRLLPGTRPAQLPRAHLPGGTSPLSPGIFLPSRKQENWLLYQHSFLSKLLFNLLSLPGVSKVSFETKKLRTVSFVLCSTMALLP